MTSGSVCVGLKPRIVVTRAAHQASALADELQRRGAEPISIPTIEIVEPDSYNVLDAALKAASRFDWLLFTSANAVRAFAKRAARAGLSSLPGRLKVGAIGSATQRALEQIGVDPEIVPATAVAESLAEALVPLARQPNGTPTRFLLVRAQDGREHLPEALKNAGAEVTVAPAYRTRMPADGIRMLRDCFAGSTAPPEGLTLTSSSAVQNLFAMLAAAGLQLSANTAVASIGPITSRTLRELGRAPDVEASQASVQALAKAVVDYLNSK